MGEISIKGVSMEKDATSVCKRNERLVPWANGEYLCLSAPKLLKIGGCGQGWSAKEDPRGYDFCAPCQTIEYSCSPDASVIQTEEICPAGDDYQSYKYPNEVQQEAEQFVWKLVDRGCTINTMGFFKDLAWKIKRFKDNKCESIELLCKDYVKTHAGERGRDGYYYGASYCPERDKATWEVAMEKTIKEWIARDKGCEVIAPARAKTLYESKKAEAETKTTQQEKNLPEKTATTGSR